MKNPFLSSILFDLCYGIFNDIMIAFCHLKNRRRHIPFYNAFHVEVGAPRRGFEASNFFVRRGCCARQSVCNGCRVAGRALINALMDKQHTQVLLYYFMQRAYEASILLLWFSSRSRSWSPVILRLLSVEDTRAKNSVRIFLLMKKTRQTKIRKNCFILCCCCSLFDGKKS